MEYIATNFHAMSENNDALFYPRVNIYSLDQMEK